MTTAAKILVGLVAFIHGYFLWLEMFAWTTLGPKTFPHLHPDFFPLTKTLAANQGLYNGLLAAGLIWSLFIRDRSWSKNVAAFFLGAVILAGAYGGATVQLSIVIFQALPALAALGAIIFMRKGAND
jgi:putative membrane protein